jgi:pyrroloquinoline quinone (PQQ) biosynthesis protein C
MAPRPKDEETTTMSTHTFGDELLAYLEPYRQAVLESPMLGDCARGALPVSTIRAWVAQQYQYVHAFPAWFGAMLGKASDSETREALMLNILEERTHPALWLQLTRAWGLSDDEVFATELCPEMQALNDYLWLVTRDGHIAEAAAAVGVALEGMSKAVIDRVGPALHRYYHGRDGVVLDRFGLMWLEAHATADPEHSREGAVVVARYATTPELRSRAKFAGRRALEFLRLGFDGVYRRFGPESAA